MKTLSQNTETNFNANRFRLKYRSAHHKQRNLLICPRKKMAEKDFHLSPPCGTQSRYTTVIILCTQKKISAYKSSGAKIGICTLFQKLDYVFALFARNLLGIQNKSTTFANKGNKEQKQENNGKERS